MTRWAAPADVEAKIGEWSQAQLACRLNKYHDWTDPRLTLLHRHLGGAITVRQTCARGCGVGRHATMAMNGRLTSKWRPDYSSQEAKKHLMRNAEGASMGRIGEDGQAAIRLAFWKDIAIVEVGDEP